MVHLPSEPLASPPISSEKAPANRRNLISTFVRGVLTYLGARVEELGEDYWEVVLPDTIAYQLGRDTRFSIYFSPSDGVEGELLTDGAPLLDDLLTLVASWGRTGELLLPGSLRPDFLRQLLHRPLPEPVNAEGLHCTELRSIFLPLACAWPAEVEGRVVSRRLLFQPQLLLWLRVSFLADERQDEIWTILADPITERVEPCCLPWERALSWSLRRPHSYASVSRTKTVEIDSDAPSTKNTRTNGVPWVTAKDFLAYARRLPRAAYPVLRLLDPAVSFVELEAKRRIGQLREQADQRLNTDRERLDAYFAAREEEAALPWRQALHRLAVAQVRLQLARSEVSMARARANLASAEAEVARLQAEYTAELQRLSVERSRRLAELESKIRVRIQIGLVAAAWLHVPRLEVTCRLTHSRRSEFVALLDLLRSRLLEPVCEGCNGPLTGARLDSEGRLLCLACSQTTNA